MGYWRFYPASDTGVVATTTGVVFVWDAVSSATSYVLQIGSTTGSTDVYDQNEGNVLTQTVDLEAGTYYSRVVAYQSTTALSTTADQVVTV